MRRGHPGPGERSQAGGKRLTGKRAGTGVRAGLGHWVGVRQPGASRGQPAGRGTDIATLPRSCPHPSGNCALRRGLGLGKGSCRNSWSPSQLLSEPQAPLANEPLLLSLARGGARAPSFRLGRGGWGWRPQSIVPIRIERRALERDAMNGEGLRGLGLDQRDECPTRGPGSAPGTATPLVGQGLCTPP